MDIVKPDRAVTIKFAMKSLLPDGTSKERPEEVMEFVYGIERQVPTLEKALFNARVGDQLNLQIPASEIYGEHDPSLVRTIPKEGLIRQRLKPGQYYRQMKKGCLVSFKVLEIRDNDVLVDFNEPMAGITVTIDVEIMAVRKATEKEIEEAREAQFKKNIGCG